MIFLFSLGFVRVAGAAGAANCLEAAAVKSVLSSIKVESADSDRFDRCREGSASHRIVQTLIFLKNLRLEKTPARSSFDQGILKEDFWGYFSKRVKRVFAVDRMVTECRGSTLAYVSPDFDSTTVYLCPGFFDSWLSVATRAEFLLHEARHFEGYGHVVCRRGLFQNQKSCDRRLQDRGSYAVSVEALSKMAERGSGLSAPSRSLLKATALVRARTNFNETP
ncbi:MAG: hypothetical protein KF802_06915 [Bdellovibrionaceae bacterium]|nr:hypothetical protein [Pseudobdellovibrionaceae bacterium]MBX3034363.1 hypothetical protein [Pseudobdellovibrionaceae bacterium]